MFVMVVRNTDTQENLETPQHKRLCTLSVVTRSANVHPASRLMNSFSVNHSKLNLSDVSFGKWH